MARTHAGRGKPAARDLSNTDLGRSGAAAGGSPALRGYLATPQGEGPFPAVLMVHEAFGLDDITVRHADRMAAAGYLTLAVDLYSDGGARRCLVATMRALSAGEGRAFTDLAAARDWL
ncbi:dienelactone hydrolase family protein, partial [Microbacterium sp. Bi128]|uniref:dienelactone hydrolase family protein n=1 Tax=Microbacterium sp. Bi128 TaxID=2821115 RepID=UPI001E51C42E